MSNQPPLTAGKFDELGTPGLEIYAGYIAKAYTADLYWPACIPIYDRIYRADPEVTMTRFLFSAWGGKLKIDCEAQETEDAPETDDDKRALDFSYSVMEDIEGGGLSRVLTDALCRVPLYGWGWWEVPNGVRNPTWKPPQGDAWRSSASDGLMGYRRLAFVITHHGIAGTLTTKTGNCTRSNSRTFRTRLLPSRSNVRYICALEIWTTRKG